MAGAQGARRQPNPGETMSEGKFLLAGVMGWPIAHSRSPLIHNHWLAERGLKGAYVPLAVHPANLEKALRALGPLGFAGANLTIPHKVMAFDMVDRRDGAAEAIGAVNTIVVGPDGTLEGRNTDAFGFIESVREAQPGTDFSRGPAVVIGAGGAARAIIHGLREAGVPRVHLVNRTSARAETLAGLFGTGVAVHDWNSRASILRDAALLVQTTSLGMQGQPELPLDLRKLPPEAVVCDIVYTPRRTALLEAAAARGNPVVEGLGMLLHQARPAFGAWFGGLPDVGPALRRILDASLPR